MLGAFPFRPVVKFQKRARYLYRYRYWFWCWLFVGWLFKVKSFRVLVVRNASINARVDHAPSGSHTSQKNFRIDVQEQTGSVSQVPCGETFFQPFMPHFNHSKTLCKAATIIKSYRNHVVSHKWRRF